jgi:putative ABC transport system permease protein
MNIRSIPQRAALSLTTVFSIALVVAVLLGFLALSNGFAATMSNSGREDVALMLRGGSQSELNSGLGREAVLLIEESAPGVARDANGDPIVSGELYVIVDGIRRASQTESNLTLRGVGQKAVDLRQNFSITQGRMFEEGSNELLVGESILGQFQGFDLGETIRLGSNEWVVVGIFSTGGTVSESEIWADLPVIQNLYQRGTSVQSIRALLTSPEAIEELKSYAENEPRLNLDVETEFEYLGRQSGGLSDIVQLLGWPLAIIMAIGALAGAWNTMYSSVDTRMREIATLRAIGFGGFSAAIGTMIESLFLAAMGGLVGSVAVYFLFDGISTSTLGSGFTQIVFTFAVTPESILTGMVLALIVGFLGGFIPAIRSATVPLLAVHRS